MPEIDPLRHLAQVHQPFGKRLRIPTRADAFAIFAVADKTRPFRQDAAMQRAIFQDRLKGTFPARSWRFLKLFQHCLTRHLEMEHTVGQPRRIATDNRFPHRRHRVVQFDHDDPLRQVLKKCGQADDAAAGERLDQNARFAILAGDPAAEGRHKPRLPARIAKRAALWDRRDIDRVREHDLLPLHFIRAVIVVCRRAARTRDHDNVLTL